MIWWQQEGQGEAKQSKADPSARFLTWKMNELLHVNLQQKQPVAQVSFFPSTQLLKWFWVNVYSPSCQSF